VRPRTDALDTNFENYVDVVGFFDPANTDTLEFVFDINGNGIQISSPSRAV
jgi:hypothetical protein